VEKTFGKSLDQSYLNFFASLTHHQHTENSSIILLPKQVGEKVGEYSVGMAGWSETGACIKVMSDAQAFNISLSSY
jgi:Sec7-like guanine-nucleotide exchange factor